MINKVIEVDIDGVATTLLDVSEVQASQSDVREGILFVDSNGELLYGTGEIGGGGGSEVRNLIRPTIEVCRFRSIPTKNEYEAMYNGGSTPVKYEYIAPLVKDGLGGYYPSLVFSNNVEEFKVDGKFVYPVYDSHNKGYLVGSLPTHTYTMEEAVDLGFEWAKFPIYQSVLDKICKKYPRFLMLTDYARYMTNFSEKNVYLKLDIASSNGVVVDDVLFNDVYAWKYTKEIANVLTDRLLVLISREIDLMFPKLIFELSKFEAVGTLLVSNNSVASVTNLANALMQLRTANHIDTNTLMTTANTPEVITGATPEQTLKTYMSSVFETKTNREDDYTKVIEHFENLLDELVSRVAFTCLMPN